VADAAAEQLADGLQGAEGRDVLYPKQIVVSDELGLDVPIGRCPGNRGLDGVSPFLLPRATTYVSSDAVNGKNLECASHKASQRINTALLAPAILMECQ
jgi:hypothetical protein